MAPPPDSNSSAAGEPSSPSSFPPTSSPKPPQESPVPTPPDKPLEFRNNTSSSSISATEVKKWAPGPAPEEEVIDLVSVKEEENTDDHEVIEVEDEVNQFRTGGSSCKTSSSSCSVDLPKPIEGLHETCPPPFLKKTFEMVDNPETNSIVSWSENGESFVVWDAYEFSKHLLPKNFKHSNFSSFIRQLNTYGFKKMDPDRWEFANEGFRGGKKHLLKNIKRRSRNNKNQQGAINGYDYDSTNHNLESQIKDLKDDQDLLKIEICNLRQQQEESENKITAVEKRIQFAHNRQFQMLIFLMKAAENKIHNLLGKIKQHKEVKGGEFGKKRRLLPTQVPETLSPSHGQSVDWRNEAEEELATMQTQLTKLLGDEMEQNETVPKLFETPLGYEFSGPTQDQKTESVYDFMSEGLIDEAMVPQNWVDKELDVNDSKFYLELEDLIGKPRNCGGYATELAGCI